MTPPIKSLDFETYYDKDYSLDKLGPHAYVRDSRFKATIVSVACVDQDTIATTPEDFLWPELHGCILVSHNREFDRLVFERLQADGVIPADVKPAAWYCSLALCRYLNYPGALGEASNYLLGWAPDKEQRKKMKGRTELTPEDFEYAKADAEACLEIFLMLEHRWPENERRLADLTEGMGRRGIKVDQDQTHEIIADLEREVRGLAERLPWGPVVEGIASSQKLGRACRALNIVPPANTTNNSPEVLSWVAANQSTEAGRRCIGYLDSVFLIRSYRKTANALRALLQRIDPATGRMSFSYAYSRASTGRWAGAGGFNMQNLNSKDVKGWDIRSIFVADNGMVFLIFDYAQIEPRVVMYLTGDADALQTLRDGGREYDLYEIHARRSMGYTDPRPLREVDPDLRKLAKARVIALSYGMGWEKFRQKAEDECGLVLTEEEARAQVRDYRKGAWRVTNLWNRLEKTLVRCDGGTCRIPLPCAQADPAANRYLHYYEIFAPADAYKKDAYVGGPNGKRVEIYGGQLLENLAQAVARDVMADAWLRCADAGFEPLLSSHDELVFEVPAATAGDDMERIRDLMEQPPSWAPDLPLVVEAQMSDRYKK